MYGQTYGYRTSLSKLMVNHIKKKFDKLIKYKNIKNNTNILDIGSNDGTFLNFFARKNKNLNYMELIRLQKNLKNIIIKELI